MSMNTTFPWQRRGRLLGAAWGLALAAAVATAPAHAAEPRRGGTLTIATEGDPSSLDPLRLGSYVERQYAMAVFDTLFEVAPDGEIVPHLAAGYDVSDDARTYQIRLREGITFHDGTALDAEAVKFNLDRVRDPANTCRCLSNVSGIERVDVVDPLTVEIRLRDPSGVLPAILADAPGMMASPTAIRADAAGFGNRPVGAGPFKVVEWTKGGRFIGQRHEGYWREGRPFVDRLVYRGLQNDETRQTTFVSGGADILLVPSARFVAQAKQDARFVVLEPKGFGSAFIGLNLKRPPLDDIRVRRAIAHATHRELLVKSIFQNAYTVADSPFGPGLKVHEAVQGYPAYDPERAKALLADYGKPVSFALQMDNTPASLLTAQALQQLWGAVGISVTLAPADQARLVQNMLTKNFDASVFRWSGRPDPDMNVFGFFHSSNAERTSSNYVGYADPQMDALLEAGRASTDLAERKQIYGEVAAKLRDDMPYAFLYYIAHRIVTTPKVHGIPDVPDSLVRVADVWKDAP